MIGLLLCMETNQKSDTDFAYIKSTIDKYYNHSRDIAIRPVYMNTKMGYKSPKVIKEIIKYQSCYKSSNVIYFIDTDDMDINMVQKNEFDEISSFCKTNGYDLVWFCREIEEVYLGKRINDNEKTTATKNYIRSKAIEQLDAAKLTSKNITNGKSNILNVLDKYMARI